LAMNPLNRPLTNSKPSAEERDSDQAQMTNVKAKNNATPVTRWKIDALAVAGIDIVVRSRFTGLCFFTVTCPSCPQWGSSTCFSKTHQIFLMELSK